MKPGSINTYKCLRCGNVIVTVDRVDGVTPMYTKCQVKGCGGHALSAFYDVDQTLQPGYEWYLPKKLNGLSMATREHIGKGGLIMRAIKKEETK